MEAPGAGGGRRGSQQGEGPGGGETMKLLCQIPVKILHAKKVDKVRLVLIRAS